MLKLVFKLALEQEIKLVDSVRAMLAFPIDVSFLSLSIGIGVLAVKAPAGTLGPHKSTAVFIISSILAMALVTVVSKKSDKLFVGDRIILSFVSTIFCYIVAMCMVMYAINVDGMIP